MESLVYRIKHKFPGLFRQIAVCAERITAIRFRNRARKALAQATITGSIDNEPARIVPLDESSASSLGQFLQALPNEHTEYFRPHGFSEKELKKILSSRAFMNYGLYQNEQLIGYALLKISPFGSAYRGRLIHPDFAALGLGRFVSRYLQWQAQLAGLSPRATISRSNARSLSSLDQSSSYRIISDLPDSYMLIEFTKRNLSKPVLNH